MPLFKIQHRRDTAANWNAANPKLLAGEIGLVTDSPAGYVSFKVGDGIKLWRDLLVASGPAGPVGPKGAPGLDGKQGPMGPAGPVGAQGATGAQGPVGPAGASGLDGKQGPTGPTGPAGAQGPKGDPGSQPPISDSVISPDSGVCASSKAVKIAYDKAVAAEVSVTNISAPKVRKINTTAPLSGGGDLSADRTLTIADATSAAKGVVQLSSAVNSTSTALAATPSAVKAAYDLAAAANTKAIPVVVNSWTDASTTKAGAVGLAKWLYDNKANKTDAVPKPTSTNWVIIEGPAASRFLPSGGTWAYFALKINSPNGIGVTCTQSAGVAPGGSRVGAGTDTGAAFGFAWKIA